MKPFSDEWYERENAWAAECNANFEREAGKMVSNGYERKDHPRPAYPVTFHKGDEVRVLVRELGSSRWYSRPFSETRGRHV